MRKRPSLATVLAALALFVSLSGTAIASVLITKNNQVAAHTIAGANAPKGDNQNLIPGSVGSKDLHAGSVTSAALAKNSVAGSNVKNGSLGAADLNLGDVSGALGYRSAVHAVEPGISSVFASFGNWSIEGDCTDDGGGNTDAAVLFDNNDATFSAFLQVGDGSGQVVPPSNAAGLDLAQVAPTNVTAFGGGTFTAQSEQQPDHLTGRVMAIVDTADTSFQGTPMTAPFCIFRVDMIGGTS